MRKIIKHALILFAITLCTGLILGAVHTLTLEPIRETERRTKAEALSGALPGASEFRVIARGRGRHGIIKEINSGTSEGKLIGYDFTVTPKGYGGLLKVVVGIAPDGRLEGIKLLDDSTETPGLGGKSSTPEFTDQFKRKNVSALTVVKTPPTHENEIEAISGATITSRGIVDGVNAALEYFAENYRGKDAAKAESSVAGK